MFALFQYSYHISERALISFTISAIDFIVWLEYDRVTEERKTLPDHIATCLCGTTAGQEKYRRFDDVLHILGFGIACLVLFGIGSMETVCVKPAEMLVKALLWPVTLMEAVVNYSSTHHNYKAAL